MPAALRRDHPGPSFCFYLDIHLAETLRRHATRPQRSQFSGEQMRQWYRKRDLLPEGGETIFLTTQYLDEADELADRIALLSQGRLVAEGTPGELKRLVPGGHLVVRFADPDGYLRAASHVGATSRDDESLTVQIPDTGVSTLRKLLEWLDTHAIDVAELSVHTPDLDDVFLALTEESSR
ncbi:DUF4162 domain-containing protein [Streptosporangium roseum]|uniref:ATP-binding protein DrrA1-3 family domain-containing protein n=1 Tax=Streptosporangium roseum TaxID=2001 RepID=UPI00331AFA56